MTFGDPGTIPNGTPRAGKFSVSFEADYGDFEAMEAAIEAGLPAFSEDTTKFVNSARIAKPASIIIAPDATVGTLAPEWGHADQAARDPLQYFKITHKELTSRYRNRDELPAE